MTAGSENITGQNKVLAERMLNIKTQIERIENELTGNSERKKSMEDAIHGDTGAEKQKESAIELKKAEIAALEKEISDQDAILEKESRELEESKSEMLANINKLSDVKSNISRCEAMKASIGQRKQKIALTLEQLFLQRTNLEEALKDQTANTAVFDETKKKLTAEKEEWLSRRQQLNC